MLCWAMVEPKNPQKPAPQTPENPYLSGASPSPRPEPNVSQKSAGSHDFSEEFLSEHADEQQLMGWLPVQEALKADLEAVYARARDLNRMARSDNTWRAYKTGWAQYEAWCNGIGVKPLSGDPGTVALFLSMLSLKVRPTTLKARLAAISVAHRMAGVPLDTRHEAIRAILKGAAREKGLAPIRKAIPLTLEELPALIATIGEGPLEIRNKAILLIGFAGALRRSEVAALRLEDIRITLEGLALTVRRAKGDQEGRGASLSISRHPDETLCPVAALEAWLTLREDKAGPLFLRANNNGSFRDVGISDQTVNQVIKTLVVRLGDDWHGFSGHSLRSGFATSAATAGIGIRGIMQQTRIKSETQAGRYIRATVGENDAITKRLFGQ